MENADLRCTVWRVHPNPLPAAVGGWVLVVNYTRSGQSWVQARMMKPNALYSVRPRKKRSHG